MKNMRLICLITLSFALLSSCAGKSRLVKFITEGGLETKGLVNLALASSGARIFVSQDNSDHPAETLINGIASSENWNQGEGWETTYDGRFARGRYVYETNNPMLDQIHSSDESYDADDPSWRGLRVRTGWGGSVNTALGWVIIEFPEKKTVNRAIVYTIDSEEYPAHKFGVSDLQLQYWTDVADSWKAIERHGKGKGQAGNAIHNNESRVVTFRFMPVQTSRMRLVIRWTNDSKQYKRGYYNNTSGTIRLVEIEIYGYERDEAAAAEAEAASINVIQDANKIAEIEIVIDNYTDGYNRRNVEMLMSSVSPDYSKDNEKYSDLKKRMESIFTKYESAKLELQNVKAELTDSGAAATSTYTAQYEEAVDGSPPITSSGVLVFQLSDATGHWKITRIDSP